MSNLTIDKIVGGTTSTKNPKNSYTKFIKYNPSDYEDYLLTLSIKKIKEFEQRVSFEKVWDEGFDQEKFYDEKGLVKEKSGVYCIMNMIDRKKYFGESFRLNLRPYEHFSKLDKNKHDNEHLQNSYNFYGRDNFIIFIVKFCHFNDLKNNESDYIEKFGDLQDNFVFNLKKDSNTKQIHSEKTLDKMSKSMCKFTYILINKLNEIYIVNNLKEFCKNKKISQGDLSNTFNKKVDETTYQASGYKILDKYLGIEQFNEYIIREKYKKEIETFLYFKRKRVINYFEKFVILTPELKIIIVFNVSDYYLKNNINNNGLSKTLNNKIYHVNFHKILAKLDIEDETEYDYSKQIEIHKKFILKNNPNNIYTIEHRNGEIKILTKFELKNFCKINKVNIDDLQKIFNKHPNRFTNKWRIINIERRLEFNENILIKNYNDK
jgi:group I intron endonuclease